MTLGLLSTASSAAPSHRTDDHDGPKPTIVLVHGAFADAFGWTGVIKRLQDRGYPVIAPATHCGAKRMHAHTVHINSPHVAMISHPDQVTHLIRRAADAN